MNKKIAAIWMSLIMLISSIFIIVEIAPTVEAPATLFVGGVGPGNYSTIQDAVNTANPGDTVFVYNGTYVENVVVGKSINLIGEDRNMTIIDGDGNGPVVSITASNVDLKGFAILNSVDDVGIKLNGVQNCQIIQNNASNHFEGIYLFSSDYNVISDNIFTLNTIGIIFMRCENTTVSNNIASNNIIGIESSSSDYNSIFNNSCNSNNNEGIYIETAPDNTGGYNIVMNNICSNNKYGIRIEGPGNNTVLNNNLSNNLYGTYIPVSPNNIIYHNNFITNTNQALDSTDNANEWYKGYPSGGNYWSDYSGVDNFMGPDQDQLGNDGIGDTEYMVDSGTFDHYPLMEPGPYKPIENYTILKHGYNLISIPLIQSDQNLSKVLEMLDGYYDVVQFYDITDTSDPWKHYKIAKPFGNDLPHLNETMGFWIHITKPGETIFVYNGTQPTENQTITLYPGWNQVGYPSKSIYNRTEGLNTVDFGTEIDKIQWFNASTQTWHELGPDDFFEPCRGYWIHATTQCEWEVPL